MNPVNLLGYAFPSASRAMHPELYPETDADLAAANALLVAQWRRRAAAPAAPGGRAPPPPGVALGPIASSRDVAELRGLLNACLPVKYPDGWYAGIPKAPPDLTIGAYAADAARADAPRAARMLGAICCRVEPVAPDAPAREMWARAGPPPRGPAEERVVVMTLGVGATR